MTGSLSSRHALSFEEACLVLFKALVGPGMLFLPSGVKGAGLLSSLLTTAAVGGLCTSSHAFVW